LGKIQVIDCGIDTQHFVPSDNITRHQYFIHNATRFSARKGSHLVAQAWLKVHREVPHASLLLLGKSGDVDMKKDLLDIPNVIYVGEYRSGSDEYIRLLSQSKWVVLPSLAEGQAGTLLEAMSCGCIPIASRASGINAEEYGGFTVEPNNVDSIIAAMLKAEKGWDNEQNFKVREIVVERNAWEKFEQHVSTVSNMLLRSNPRKLPSVAAVFQDFIFHFVRDASKRHGAA
jgi:glycosyltransferase involved in cell wall biosynthesis